MDPTEPQDEPRPGGLTEAPRTGAGLQAEARHERRAEALRANLKRRKAQMRGRAEGERTSAPD